MLNIAITGHTRGFGKFMFERLGQSHSVTGFSKSLGFDISSKIDRNKIIELTDDYDIFINNAHQGFHQSEMMYDRFANWHNKEKLILNIGSNARDFTNRDRPYEYSVQKTALNHASKQLGRADVCKVTTVDFGFLIRDTGSSIGYEDAFDYVLIALNARNKSHRVLEILVAHE